MTVTYTQIPQIGQWKADTSISFTMRNRDEGLARIDKFLEEYHRAEKKEGSRSAFVLCDLFLALNAWVKRFHAIGSQSKFRASDSTGEAAPTQPGLASVGDIAYQNAKQRYPSILKLLDVVFRKLQELEISEEKNEDSPGVNVHAYKEPATGSTAAFHSSYRHVTDKVMDMASVGMKPLGFKTDTDKNMQPFDTDQLAQFRVWFKGGKAYQVNWWDNKPSLKLKPANSLHAHSLGANNSITNYGSFVMTTDLEIYMTKHNTGKGTFHSSYNNQKPVLFAGTILIESGTIRGVRCDSGHYQPDSHEFRRFLRHLSSLGVSLSRIKVWGYAQNDLLGMADDFIREKPQASVAQKGEYVDVT